MDTPLSTSQERELVAAVARLRGELALLTTCGLTDSPQFQQTRHTLEAAQRTIRESGDARRGEARASRERQEAYERQQAEREKALKKREKDCEAWLRARLSEGPVLKSSLERDAVAVGYGQVLHKALETLEVREIKGAYLFGSMSEDAGGIYWRIDDPMPPVDRPAETGV